MTVSVVIPTYNGAKTIVETINSVLAQTFDDVEVIVSDDGSDDGTLTIIGELADDRVRILGDTSHVGPGPNWDRALAAASGEYVKILAQDDLIYPECLAVQVAALKMHPAAAFSSVRREIIGSEGSVLVTNRGLTRMTGEVDLVTASRRTVRTGTNPFGEGAAVLARTVACRSVGRFDDSIPYVIDVDFWMRLLKEGPAVAVAETHAAFRVSAASWSNALGRDQGRLFVRFVERLAEDSDRGITRGDLLIGRLRALLNGEARQLFYARHRSRL
jgi:glycosyltransferase involved in cell wall biosynthesis